MDRQNRIERILFRRALEHKLEGYTLDTAVEIDAALREDEDRESYSAADVFDNLGCPTKNQEIEGYNGKGPTHF
jgi:hypothetical protein